MTIEAVPKLTVGVEWQFGLPIWKQYGFDLDPDSYCQYETVANTPRYDWYWQGFYGHLIAVDGRWSFPVHQIHQMVTLRGSDL